MKEEEFLEKLKRSMRTDFEEGLIYLKLSYSLDDKGEVLLDKESMQEEFDNNLQELKNILNKSD